MQTSHTWAYFLCGLLHMQRLGLNEAKEGACVLSARQIHLNLKAKFVPEWRGRENLWGHEKGGEPLILASG